MIVLLKITESARHCSRRSDCGNRRHNIVLHIDEMSHSIPQHPTLRRMHSSSYLPHPSSILSNAAARCDDGGNHSARSPQLSRRPLSSPA
jgi:hypothetical protein